MRRSLQRVTRALLRRWPLPALTGALGKEERGTILAIGGSDEVPGAVVLAATAALRAGAGTLQIATTRRMAAHVAIAVPEARVIGLPATRSGELARGGVGRLHGEVERADAILVGPGMARAAAGRALHELQRRRRPEAALVVDAGALALLAHGPCGARTVVTPHAGEMAKLCAIDRAEVLARPESLAREVAAELGVVVVLKGECTYIAGPDGQCFENRDGNLGLGTSGSGDVLSGIIAGLCARRAEPLQAAVWGVHLHACAGDVLARKLAPLGFLARELSLEVPPLLARRGGT